MGAGGGVQEPRRWGTLHSHPSYSLSSRLDFQMLLSLCKMLHSVGVTDKSLLSDRPVGDRKVKRVRPEDALYLSVRLFDCGFQPFFSDAGFGGCRWEGTKLHPRITALISW